jgi:oligoendopeptidase F
MRVVRSCPVVLGLLLVFGLAARAAAVERSEVPDKYKWKLSDLFADEAAWAKARDEVAARIPDLGRFEGHLAESAAKLHEALSTILEVERRMSYVYVYAFMLSDQDRRVSRSLEMQQEAEALQVKFETATAFVSPEILKAGAERVNAFVAAEPRLKEYDHLLQDILRRAPHTLSPAEEKLVAQAGLLSDAGQAAHGIFTNAELPYPEITLSTGDRVRLDAAAYTRWRAAADRRDRDQVFKAFWGEYAAFRRTFGVTLYSHVKGHIFNRDVHKYESCLEAALFPFAVPTKVYEQLVADVHANLPTLHRYLRLRQKLMGIDQLRYEDLYAPILKKVDMQFTPEQGMEVTIAACTPLGGEYVEALRTGFGAGWVDFMPSTGKRSGAYSESVYGVHPFQLQNFMGRYEDVSTLAHECGHSMHSYLADKSQPYATRNYPIFVAEVASTLNENLLFHHMLDGAKDDATRLFLLGSYLDNMRQTLFRQALFAEFELRIHEQAEKGATLSGDNMSALYGDLLRTYYGDAQGVCKVDSLYSIEWAYIQHFYYNFYVYQYATSMIASISIANRIRDEAAAKPPVTRARDAYLKMLGSGGAQYPIDLLRTAGVDMTTSEPFKAAMREMNQIMDEMEKILAKTGGKPPGT